MKIRSVSFIGRIVPALIAALAVVVVPDVARTADANLRPKNIILMIADGTGTNTIAATGMYTGKLGKQIFDGDAWTKTYVSTYPLRTGEAPREGPQGLAQDPDPIYDPAVIVVIGIARSHDDAENTCIQHL